MTKQKPKILFVYDHKYPKLWMDGLWAALNVLEEDFEVDRMNLAEPQSDVVPGYDFVLAWGGFHSQSEEFVRDLPGKKGLCVGGNAIEPYGLEDWDCIFYETQWYYDTVLSRYEEDLPTMQKEL